MGNSGRMMALQHALAPGMTEWRMARMVDRMHFPQNQRTVVTRGNLFEPMSLGDGTMAKCGRSGVVCGAAGG